MKRWSLILAAALLGLALSCQATGETIPLEAPVLIGVSLRHEAVRVSWGAVEGATGYMLYYTDDGSIPDTESTAVAAQPLTTSSYIHANLSPTTLYRYAAVALRDAEISRISDPSDPVSPEIIVRLYVHFSAYASRAVGAAIRETDQAGVSLPGGYFASVYADTDASGDVILALDCFKNRFFEFTVFKDADDDGRPADGDVLWGAALTGGNTEWFSVATDYGPPEVRLGLTTSASIAISPWETYEAASGTHVWF